MRSERKWALVPCLVSCAIGVAACGGQAVEEDLGIAVGAPVASSVEILPDAFEWETVANNGTVIPGGGGKKFNSYNQPSVNGTGFVVFRARSKGSDGGGGETGLRSSAAAAETGPVRGIFTRDMADPVSPGEIETFARTGEVVPQPNNTASPFNEFPSIPRIDLMTRTIATRGQSRPVWEFVIDAAGATSRVGTSGVYANPAGGGLVTGLGILGAVTDFETSALVFPQFQVPGTRPGTRFDQFPGAPGVAGALPGKRGSTAIVFKGNWTDFTGASPVGRTGVYFRDVRPADAGGDAAVVRIADNAATKIPGHHTVFGSTAPPSGANGHMVFVGSDNEENPTKGGVYRAPLKPDPKLQALVKIGGKVKDFKGKDLHVPGTRTPYRFTRFGEGLSFDGRYVSFWAAWGSETRSIELACPADGNQAVIQYCMEHSALAADGTYTGKYLVTVPVNQGLFVYDTLKDEVAMTARTGAHFEDFLFWNYSGRPPGTGEGEEGGEDTLEPPRWRSNAFTAVNAPLSAGSTYRLAYKAVRPDGTVGIYMAAGPETKESSFRVVVDTQTSAWALDPDAPAGDAAGTPLTVTSVGLERDAFRSSNGKHGWSFLAINAGMANADASVSWAGVYLTRMSDEK